MSLIAVSTAAICTKEEGKLYLNLFFTSQRQSSSIFRAQIKGPAFLDKYKDSSRTVTFFQNNTSYVSISYDITATPNITKHHNIQDFVLTDTDFNEYPLKVNIKCSLVYSDPIFQNGKVVEKDSILAKYSDILERLRQGSFEISVTSNSSGYAYNSFIPSNILKSAGELLYVSPRRVRDDNNSLLPNSFADNDFYYALDSNDLGVGFSSHIDDYFNSLNLDFQESHFDFSTGAEAISFTCNRGNSAKEEEHSQTTLTLSLFNTPKFEESTTITKNICADKQANNFYGVGSYPACDGTNLSATIVDDYDNQVNSNYLLVADQSCCEYTDNTDTNTDSTTLTVEIKSQKQPSAVDAADGELLVTWSGGVGPYNLNFTCASTDADCSNTDFDLTSTTEKNQTITGLSGISPNSLTDKYVATITDSNSILNIAEFSDFEAVDAVPNYICSTATAINYDSGSGISANDELCRTCNATTGKLDSVGIILRSDNNPTYVFEFEDSQITDSLTSAGNGSIIFNFGFNTFVNTNYFYNYNFAGSPQYQDGSGDPKFVLGRKSFSKADVENYYDGFNGTGIEKAANLYENGTAITTNSTDITGGGFSSNATVAPGRYVAKLNYSDSDTVHELEQCFVYSNNVNVVKKPGCTDTAATNYVGDTDANNLDLYYSDPSLCVDNTFDTFSDTFDSKVSFRIKYDNNNIEGAQCSFRVSVQWKLNEALDVMSGSAQIAGVWNTLQGNDYNFKLIVKAIASEVLGFSYISPDIVFDSSNSNDVNLILREISGVSTSETSYIYTAQADNSFNYYLPGSDVSTDISRIVYLGTQTGNINFQVGALSSLINIAIKYNGSAQFNTTFQKEILPESLLGLVSAVNVFGDDNFNTLISTETNIFAVDGLCGECEAFSDSLVEGCTDPLSCNYNPDATVDNGSCVTSYVSADNVFGGGVILYEGEYFNPCETCNEDNYLNSNSAAVAFWEYVTSQSSFPQYSEDIGFFPCTNPSTCFSSNSAGSSQCIEFTPGCTDPVATNYNPEATQDDGSCQYTGLSGCTDETACNYNSQATVNDGSCYYDITDTEDQQCSLFSSWEISAATGPTVCNGTTSDGTFTISNSQYSGEFVLRFGYIPGDSYEGFGISSGPDSNQLLISAFGAESTTLPTVATIDSGNYPAMSITVNQTLGDGTSVVFSGFPIGVATLQIYPNPEAIHGDTCFCVAGQVANSIPNNPAIGDVTYNTAFSVVKTTFVFKSDILLNEFTGGRASGNCGCCIEGAANYDPSVLENNPAGCQPGLCLFDGCTDATASNYNPQATIDDGSCLYGLFSVTSLYSPAFCMPKELDEQIDIIRRCIATAGTNSYINMITGKSSCAFKDAWRLIIIEYLMSKKGLDCVYNCADPSTPSLDNEPSCADKNIGTRIGSLAQGLEAGQTRTFKVGDVIGYKTSASDLKYYVLQSLPGGAQSIVIKHPNDYASTDPEKDLHLLLTPSQSTRWYICEEPPVKTTTKNYLGKFVNFVQNYCRQCQIEPDTEQTPDTTPLPGVVTINGMVITVNNNNFE